MACFQASILARVLTDAARYHGFTMPESAPSPGRIPGRIPENSGTPDPPRTSGSLSDLAVAICTCNNMRTFERTLHSVHGLAGRIVVVDSGSSDGTIELAESFGAEVVHFDWAGPVVSKQHALDLCSEHAWVLNLDSDESLDDTLRDSVASVVQANSPAHDGWELNRKTWFLGGWLQHTFQPEWRLRLVRGGKGMYVGSGSDRKAVHERIEVPGAVGRLTGDCRHDSWVDVNDMLLRTVKYAHWAAQSKPRGGRAIDILVRPPAAVFKQLILKRGLRDGPRGIVAAGGMGASTLLKHICIAAARAGLLDSPDALRSSDDDDRDHDAGAADSQ